MLKPGYVTTDVVLEYAGTVHAAQGGTRDVAHVVVSRATTRSALYVGHPRVRGEQGLRGVPRPVGVADGPVTKPLAVPDAHHRRGGGHPPGSRPWPCRPPRPSGHAAWRRCSLSAFGAVPPPPHT